MPLLKLHSSVPVPEKKMKELLPALSKLLADATGKPEKYVMVVFEQATACMAGSVGPAAFADVRGIGGLSQEVNTRVSAELCRLLGNALGIPSDRIYLTFTDVPASNWGWKGATF